MNKSVSTLTGKENTSTNAIISVVLNNKALILLVVAFISSIILTGGNTFAVYNLTSLLRQVPAYVIIAIGYTILFASGQFDMSAGSILSLCTVMYAKWALTYPLAVAMICVILLAIACEFINGIVIRTFNLNGFVLTLATSEMINGLAGQITKGGNVSGLSDAAKFLGQKLIFNGIPVSFLIAVLVIIVASVIITKTIYGRHLLATGGNREAAKVSGIKTDKMYISSFAFLGACVGVCSIVLTGRLGLGSPTAGSDYALDCIAGVVIGGTTMHGGKAKVSGTLFGMCLIIVINNMLDLLGINTYWKMVAKGAIIVLAIMLDSISEKVGNAQRSKE